MLDLVFPFSYLLWALGDQTQALKRARQALDLVSHLPSLLLKNLRTRNFIPIGQLSLSLVLFPTFLC